MVVASHLVVALPAAVAGAGGAGTREEPRLMLGEFTQQGRRVATSAGLLVGQTSSVLELRRRLAQRLGGASPRTRNLADARAVRLVLSHQDRQAAVPR
jgi:hypothetical protein